MIKKILCNAFLGLILTFSLNAQGNITLSVENYEEQNDTADESGDSVWEVMELKADNLTEYLLVEDEDGKAVIKGDSKNAASGLIYKVDIDPEEYSIIEWRWKIDSVLDSGDLRKKDGDDYPARIYITFNYDFSDLGLGDKIKYRAIKTFTSYDVPLRAINYIWANKADKGTITKNPFSDWVQMIVIQSGNNRAGKWISETQNIYEDYKEAFGKDPPRITGVAIMTDSDNTGESATGWYGDIIFKKSGSN